jgi:hypothetical protein
MQELIAWNKETDLPIKPERHPIDGEWARHENGVKKEYNKPVNLQSEKDYGSKITKRALSQRLNPVIRKALRNTTDDIAIDIREDLKLDYTDLKDPDLITSFKYLVYAGFMTQEESDLVTDAPVTKSEAY